jgi:hypothetical protein
MWGCWGNSGIRKPKRVGLISPGELVIISSLLVPWPHHATSQNAAGLFWLHAFVCSQPSSMAFSQIKHLFGQKAKYRSLFGIEVRFSQIVA